jgi:hypothetical protein
MKINSVFLELQHVTERQINRYNRHAEANSCFFIAVCCESTRKVMKSSSHRKVTHIDGRKLFLIIVKNNKR